MHEKMQWEFSGKAEQGGVVQCKQVGWEGVHSPIVNMFLREAEAKSDNILPGDEDE